MSDAATASATPFDAAAHLPALEEALDALSAMRAEFAARAERWFFTLACGVLADNDRLHRRLAALQAATTRWGQRDALRQLAVAVIEVADGCSQFLRGAVGERLDQLADNPVLREPLAALRDRFADFRRIRERDLRVLAKALGRDPAAKERERLAFDADPDVGLWSSSSPPSWWSGCRPTAGPPPW